MSQLRRRRWLYSPITSWQARHIARVTGTDHDAAWEKIRTTTHPEEAVFHKRRTPPDPPQGL
ncbi:hypothetical protein [Streptomyces albipurpureus]|uniref:Transposase n=1 Tax=Streptomyces albipurpureus TaxID=2897419 RepID=A0ABT0V0P9_9ACTN|nr:hypothetical protein [Streptomyces sp. CWNU-1]MCM2394423.1 hypothetical protein [Streptomyces sp. CWNU-1]